MTVVHLSSEVAPFSKTGGLADVAAALPEALARAGLEVIVVSPCYPSVLKAGKSLTEAAAFQVRVGDKTSKVRLMELRYKGVRRLFVDEPKAFNRPGLYGDGKTDFPDNAERFILFCRAALAGLDRTGTRPDVIHCHDWQTALVPLFLKEHSSEYSALAGSRTVLTIHNLGYQGNFPKEKFKLLEVPDRLFSAEGMEFFGSVSFLKTGLLFADKLTTVSPTYAEEIQTQALGSGLEGVLRAHKRDLVGILNGIDTEIWNPATDPYLFRTFGTPASPARPPSPFPPSQGRGEERADTAGDAVQVGKSENKAGLAHELRLRSDGSCLLGCVTRLAGQKGIDKIIALIPELVSAGARVAILGTGSPEYEAALKRLACADPDSVSVTVGFSEQLAHRIYAGSDFFLMPSEYEPCGLGQMISLRYGTLPVASRTGGLADSIIDLDENPDTGTGFLFTRSSSEEFGTKLRHALELYRNSKRLAQVRRRAMGTDFSWTARCREYVRLYDGLLMMPRTPA